MQSIQDFIAPELLKFTVWVQECSSMSESRQRLLFKSSEPTLKRLQHAIPKIIMLRCELHQGFWLHHKAIATIRESRIPHGWQSIVVELFRTSLTKYINIRNLIHRDGKNILLERFVFENNLSRGLYILRDCDGDPELPLVNSLTR